MPNENQWLKLWDWTVEKVKDCDTDLVPMSMEAMINREEPEKDYQFFLENASRTMIRFKKPERLIRMIVRTIDEHVKVTHTGMLLLQKDRNCFTLIDSEGADGVKMPIGFVKLDFENPLIKLFEGHYNYKLFETGTVEYKSLLDILLRNEEVKEDEKLTELINGAIKNMELLKANICIPVYYKKDLVGIFVMGRKLSNSTFSRQEISFFTTLANDVAMALSNAQLIEELQENIYEVHRLYEKEHNTFIQISISLAAAIDARDPYTHGHTERVTKFALAIAEELEDIPEADDYKNFTETLHVAALLHDVGKIGVPDSILNKRGQLTKEEYERVKQHPTTGATILSPIKELGDIAMEVKHHHERYDGKGYPDGLKGEEIPFIARIISVADTYDAIISDRPYRQKKMSEVALQIIKDNSGTQFDPLIVSAFLLSYRKGRLVIDA